MHVGHVIQNKHVLNECMFRKHLVVRVTGGYFESPVGEARRATDVFDFRVFWMELDPYFGLVPYGRPWARFLMVMNVPMDCSAGDQQDARTLTFRFLGCDTKGLIPLALSGRTMSRQGLPCYRSRGLGLKEISHQPV